MRSFDRAGTRRGDDGFTMVELLVVMVIISTLVAIAIPSFFSQRSKGRDADARSGLAVAQRAIETYATDNDSSYAGADATDLVAIEGTLSGVALDVGPVSADGYTLEVVSADGHTFTVARSNPGTIVRTCAPAGSGGCPPSGLF